MNAKFSVFVICIEATIYLLLYNLYDCTFEIRVNEELHPARSGVGDKCSKKRLEVSQIICAISDCAILFKGAKNTIDNTSKRNETYSRSSRSQKFSKVGFHKYFTKVFLQRAPPEAPSGILSLFQSQIKELIQYFCLYHLS